jgi:hypothetical protein
MISKIYKRLKFTVDGFSTAQKLFVFLLWLASLGGNFYQHGLITEKDNTIAKIVASKETIIKSEPVFVRTPPKVTERVIIEKPIIKDCSDHEKRMHR